MTRFQVKDVTEALVLGSRATMPEAITLAIAEALRTGCTGVELKFPTRYVTTLRATHESRLLCEYEVTIDNGERSNKVAKPKQKEYKLMGRPSATGWFNLATHNLEFDPAKAVDLLGSTLLHVLSDLAVRDAIIPTLVWTNANMEIVAAAVLPAAQLSKLGVEKAKPSERNIDPLLRWLVDPANAKKLYDKLHKFSTSEAVVLSACGVLKANNSFVYYGKRYA